MNEYERQRRIAESTKKLYPPGTRIELISINDPYAPVLTGTRGTVKFVDSMGTIFPEWDNGRSLGVVPGEDSFRKLTQEEIEAEKLSETEVEDTENFGFPIKSKTKDGYQIAYPGDSIDTAFSGQNSRRGRVGSQIAHTLTTSATQAVFYLLPERENDRISHRPLTQSVKRVGRNESNEMDTRVHFIDLNPDPKLTEIARCITARHDSGISNRKGEHSGVFVESTNFTDDEKFAVAFVDPNGEVHIGRIRKLTPRECWKLQGFTDDQFDKAKATGLSDSRLYKMAGNAVTVNVISEIGKIIKKADSKI